MDDIGVVMTPFGDVVTVIFMGVWISWNLKFHSEGRPPPKKNSVTKICTTPPQMINGRS